ncbi:MAG: VWA domain-containing protein [Gemmatimonadaceae bacterium]
MASFAESLFEFLFKFRPVVFERGQLAFGAAWPIPILIALGAAAAVAVLLTYLRVRGRSTRGDRFVLGGIRVLALAIIVVCLMRPMLVVAAAIPQRSVLGILVDDSRSMRIADAGGQPRSSQVAALLGGSSRDSALARSLGERFILRYFTFSAATRAVNDADGLEYSGRKTRIGNAIEHARQELASSPLAGLVVVSDGADNGSGDFDGTLASLRARGLPVHTIGVGQEKWARDIQIGRVDAPRSVLQGGSIALDVVVQHRGYAGQTVQLVVEDAGRIVSTRDVKLPSGGEAVPVRVRVPALETGPRRFRLRVPTLAGEMVQENNQRHVLVSVRDRREKILYLEGEPRFELKFIRRAVMGDENLQLVMLQRTAENKFLRLGVDDSLELVGGFPRSRDALFAYRGIILGSIEASFFTADQLRMLADFVGERGGGLLMLGGRRAFAEGGYAGTPLAEVIPISLESPGDGTTERLAELDVSLTAAGAAHAATQIASTEKESAVRWTSLPNVSSVNRVKGLKAGATSLLEGRSADDQRQVVLAHQRYGKGKTIAMPVQDSWMWQMHAEVAVDDMSHEVFWRQLLRWLVSDTRDRVEVDLPSDIVATGEAAELRASLRDELFVDVNGASMTARVTDPTGAVRELPMEWSVERDGEYRATLATDTISGLYSVQVKAKTPGDSVFLTSETSYIRAEEPEDEFFDAGMRAPLLQRIARETGGRFYTSDNASSLARDIVYTSSGVTELERKDLWDMPVILFTLLALVVAEWGYRRARGLA